MTETPGPTVTARPGWWNGWHTATVLIGSCWFLWAALIIGRLSHGDTGPLVLRHLNAIALTGLSCGALMTFVLASNKVRRERDLAWQAAVKAEIRRLRTGAHTAIHNEIRTQVAEPLEQVAGHVARLNDRLFMRRDDDPWGPSGEEETVPLTRQIPPPPRQVVYAGVAAMRGGDSDGSPTVEEVVDRIMTRWQSQFEKLNERVEEYGQQKYYRGYADRAEDSGGGVVPINRNGHRSSTS